MDTTTVPAAGTYQATAPTTASRALTAPVGPALTTTLISDWSGSFSMALPGYDFVRGALRVNPNGSLSLGTGNVVVHQDGKVEPAVIVGTSVGGTIAATVNGQAFSVSLTTIQNQPVTISQMVGNYLSTSTSNGIWIAFSMTINTSGGCPLASCPGSLLGYGYATEAEAKAGGDLNLYQTAVRRYVGTITPTSVPASCGDCVAPPNAFNIGFSYAYPASGGPPSTSGFAYFTSSGLIALTVNPNTGEQLTATFAKQ